MMSINADRDKVLITARDADVLINSECQREKMKAMTRSRPERDLTCSKGAVPTIRLDSGKRMWPNTTPKDFMHQLPRGGLAGISQMENEMQPGIGSTVVTTVSPTFVDPSTVRGLTESEAGGRLQSDGYNELPSAKPRSIWAIAWNVVREPMFLLLLGAGTVYLLLGDLEEALLLLGFVFVVIGITLYQERKTERALEALRDLSSPRALVIREGRQRRIAGREVVREDIVLLAEGDRVPADAVLLSAVNLAADESLLTGESVAVRKTVTESKTARARPGGDDLPFVYSGTLIVGGQGIAEVLATGVATELGKIGKALQTVETEDTPLQRQTRRLVQTLAMVGGSLCLLVTVLYGLSRGDWLNGVLAGVALAMAMLPEEFPVVLTIFFSPGGVANLSKTCVDPACPCR